VFAVPPRWLFLRVLAAVYACAFASLLVQVRGLVGSRGILPAAEFLPWVAGQTGAERYWLLPTLFWIDARDATLVGLGLAGVILSLLLFLRIAPRLVLLVLWMLYLSFSSVGQVFLGYQWDALLLETGVLATLFAPPGFGNARSEFGRSSFCAIAARSRGRPRAEGEPAPSRLALWLLRFLLIRLMLSSGLVKLLSGDPTWWSLGALNYHYWTQPLPTPVAWYVHQLPAWFHALSTAIMFVVELLAPLLALGPRPVRHGAAWALLGLQALIALTGNYAFFNLLTAALVVLLFESPPAAPRQREHPVMIAACGFFFLLGAAELLGTLGVRSPPPLRWLRQAAAPFSLVNRYGLFAVMTTSRPEIVIEGSADGVEWKPYTFRYKPGDPLRAPRFVAPHQPRLDWQMWFAALGSCEENDWLQRLMVRLLEGSPPVLGLLAENPFPAAPPAHVRAVLYDYRFTARGEPGWWRREPRGLYCPVASRYWK
jgi:lipase maturation factor 1